MSRQWRAKANHWTILKPLAQRHRREPTDAEQVLWQAIRNGQIAGFKFRRQHAVYRYIVDFYCREASIVLEVDGAIHKLTPEEDAVRQRMLESQDLIVLRFSNDDILTRPNWVIDRIRSHLPLSANGEGAGG